MPRPVPSTTPAWCFVTAAIPSIIAAKRPTSRRPVDSWNFPRSPPPAASCGATGSCAPGALTKSTSTVSRTPTCVCVPGRTAASTSSPPPVSCATISPAPRAAGPTSFATPVIFWPAGRPALPPSSRNGISGWPATTLRRLPPATSRPSTASWALVRAPCAAPTAARWLRPAGPGLPPQAASASAWICCDFSPAEPTAA